MKVVRTLALVAAALLASISCWPQWPAQTWHWMTVLPQRLASLPPVADWPPLAVFWFFCPAPNWLGGGCGYYTTQMILVRILAGGGPIVAAGVGFLVWKLKKKGGTA
jgi:hypothetical protein